MARGVTQAHFFDGTLSRKLDRKATGLPGILKFDNGSPFVLLTNSCHQNVTIQQDKPLGVFTSVVELDDEPEHSGVWTLEERDAVDLEHLFT